MASRDDPSQPQLPEHEKRDSERIQILGELRGEVMVFQHMTIREISLGGAQVETAMRLQLDSLHEFKLALGDRSVIVKGRVAHCSISDVDQELVTYRSGIQFVEPSERVLEVIGGFIHAIQDGRRAI
jgi:PilZ domain